MYSKIIKKLRDLENGKKGLWINNLTLKKSLEVGDTINCIYDFENKVLIIEKADLLGSHTVSFRKSNPNIPILDIKKIHGLRYYKLSGVKTWDRYILGNGVVDMFRYVAERIKEANRKIQLIAA